LTLASSEAFRSAPLIVVAFRIVNRRTVCHWPLPVRCFKW
jgi:hypothetical protein